MGVHTKERRSHGDLTGEVDIGEMSWSVLDGGKYCALDTPRGIVGNREFC